MDSRESTLLDGTSLHDCLDSMAEEIASVRTKEAPIRLVGVRTRGVPIAERLAGRLSKLLGGEVPVGAVDITLYRDDLDLRRTWPVLHGTEIPFDVEGADVVLVDDVLYTGRTIRAAMNSICDLGRPARIRLAVVVDRGGRELPIHADHVGRRVSVTEADRVVVRISPIDGEEGVFRVARG